MRLSTEHRHKIRRRLIEDNFHSRKVKLSDQMVSLGVMVYDATYTPVQKGQMEALPRGWLPECTKIKAQLGSDVVQLPLDRLRCVPFDKKAYGDSSEIIFSCDWKHTLATTWDGLHQEEKAIEAESFCLASEIDAVLYSVTTTSKLIEVWPEIKNLVEEICQTRDIPSLPAPRVQDLNMALGLGQKQDI